MCCNLRSGIYTLRPASHILHPDANLSLKLICRCYEHVWTEIHLLRSSHGKGKSGPHRAHIIHSSYVFFKVELLLFLCACKNSCVHSTQFLQYVSARVLLCSLSCMRECFICDTIAALPELIHRCQNQHMLLSYDDPAYVRAAVFTRLHQGWQICTVRS